MFEVITSNTLAVEQTNRMIITNHNLQRTFVTCVKSKKHFALRYVKEVFPDIFSSPILSHKVLRTNFHLKTMYLTVKKMKKKKRLEIN